MKKELGIKVCCKNCKQCTDNGNGCGLMEMSNDFIFGSRHCAFSPSKEAYEARIKELQEQQFTKQEAEKIETFLVHGYQMMINENKKIFSKLEKMKGE